MIYDIKQTQNLAIKIANNIEPGDAVLLNGALGAGKSTLAKFIIESLGLDYCGSPTFSKIITYEKTFKLWHCDLYQMENTNQLHELIYEIDQGILLVEWAKQCNELKYIENFLEIEIESTSCNHRKININKHGKFSNIDFSTSY